MWKEIIEVFSAVLVSMGGIELLKWLATRKASARKASAEADRADISAKSDELQVLKDLITFTQAQMEQMQEWLRREQTEHAKDKAMCQELQTKYDRLKAEYDDLKRRYDELTRGRDTDSPQGRGGAAAFQP